MSNRFSSREKKTAIKNSVGRLIVVTLLLLIQLYWLINLLVNLSVKYPIINTIIGAFAIVLVISINSNRKNSSFKTPLMLVVLAFPIVGIILFLLLFLQSTTRTMRKNYKKINTMFDSYITQDVSVYNEINDLDPSVANQFKYIDKYALYPSYRNTYSKYFSDTNEALDSMIEELGKANSFIFLEYHAIENRLSFSRIKEVLIEKAKQGVEVRILYDDIGSFVFVSKAFINEMESYGISCRVFNPMMPFFNLFINNRDHRKIMIIDGKVAFTGGFNLADEYFNITNPYGVWKDSGILIKGNAVRNFTSMFLEMWNSVKISDSYETTSKYFNVEIINDDFSGFIAPYADNPIDNEIVGENVYLNILNNSKKYCWFITPYLIITDEMKRSFELAVKRGVDVRIIIPGIPDKRLIYQITKSYYTELAEFGIKIYRFSSGFCHSKMCISDDELSVVGTINLDYRSLYHHFENAVLLYNCDTISEVKTDFLDLFSNKCENITDEALTRKNIFIRIIQSLLRLFAPLL